MRRNGFLSPNVLCRVIVLGLLLTFVGCNTTNGWAVNRAGMRQYARGHYAQARHRFARAVAHDPCNADYRHNLAMALQKQGDLVGSEKIMRHNLTINAMHHPTYHSLAQLMISQGRAPEAQELLAGWVATQPYVPESNVELAWLQRETGDIGGAEQSLRNALRASPTHPVALAHLGQLYQGTGRNEEAVAYYQRSLAANWDQPEVQSRLATLQEPGKSTRSAMMQNRRGTPIMASNPIVTNGPVVAGLPFTSNEAMMVSATSISPNPMIASFPMADPASSAETAIPFGVDPQVAELEDIRSNPAPRRRRKNQKDSGKDFESKLAAYPLPDFGTPANAWVPAGTVAGQPNINYQTAGLSPDAIPQVGMPLLNAPQLAESVGTPYVSNTNGPTLIPQADPAHMTDITPDVTASIPVVDPH